jgi:hypothetical protein
MIGERYESGNAISRDGSAMTTLRLDTSRFDVLVPILDKPLSERNVRARFLVLLRVDTVIGCYIKRKESGVTCGKSR